MKEFNIFLNYKGKKILISSNLGDLDQLIKFYSINNNESYSNFERKTINELSKSIYYCFNNEYKHINYEEVLIIFYEFLNSSRSDNNDIYDLIPDISFNIETSNICLKTINEIRKGLIINHNDKIDILIKDFEIYLKNKKYIDDIELIKESINLINKSSKEDIKKALGIKYEYSLGILEDTYNDLSYIESILLESLKNKLGEIEILKALPINDSNNIKSFKTYGFYQEVENVINIINKDKLPIEEVEILVSDSKYDNSLKAYLENYSIPYYFSYGINIKCFDLYGLLDSIISFHVNHYSIKDLYDIYKNKSLNNEVKNINELTNLRADLSQISNYVNKNDKFKDPQKSFINDLLNIDKDKSISNLYIDIINLVFKYSIEEYKEFIKDTLLEKISLFKLIDNIGVGDNKFKLILDLLDDVYIDYKDDIDAPHLKMSKLSNINYLTKKYIFLIGLSSSQLNLKEVESPLLSDNSIKNMLDNKYYIDLASENNNRFNNKLERLIKYNKCSNIYLSYSSYDSNEFRNITPSVFYIKYKNKEEVINVNNHIELKSKEGINPIIIPDDLFKRLKDNRYFSPSSLNTLYKCPLQYLYQKYYEEIELSEYEHNWLKANEGGTFIHKVLETYYNKFKDKHVDKVEFDKIFDEISCQTQIEHPFDNDSIIDKYLSHYRKIIYQYIEESSSDSYKVLCCERKFDKVTVPLYKYEYIFSGCVDRVDYCYKDKKHLLIKIIDYKTGSKKSLSKDGLIQSFIYKYAIDELLKSNEFIDKIGSYSLDNIEYKFYYVYFSGKERDVLIDDDEVIKNKEASEKKLESFDKLENNVDSFIKEFNPKMSNSSGDNEGGCSYCNFKSLCAFKRKLSFNKNI